MIGKSGILRQAMRRSLGGMSDSQIFGFRNPGGTENTPKTATGQEPHWIFALDCRILSPTRRERTRGFEAD